MSAVNFRSNVQLANFISRMGNRISVQLIRECSCGAPATRLIQGAYARCQPCANEIVNLWNEMRQARLDAMNEGKS